MKKTTISFTGAFKVDYDKVRNCLVVLYTNGKKIYLDCSGMEKK